MLLVNCSCIRILSRMFSGGFLEREHIMKEGRIEEGKGKGEKT